MYGNYMQMMPMRKTPFTSLAPKDELKMEMPQILTMEPKKGLIAKKVGKLTVEERQRKIERYRAKKSLRVWEKRINYNCRKQVADKRLRIKGRFISKEEAVVLLKHTKNEDNEQVKINENEMEHLMQRKVFNIITYQKNETN